jgi:hypothetical protein
MIDLDKYVIVFNDDDSRDLAPRAIQMLTSLRSRLEDRYPGRPRLSRFVDRMLHTTLKRDLVTWGNRGGEFYEHEHSVINTTRGDQDAIRLTLWDALLDIDMTVTARSAAPSRALRPDPTDPRKGMRDLVEFAASCCDLAEHTQADMPGMTEMAAAADALMQDFPMVFDHSSLPTSPTNLVNAWETPFSPAHLSFPAMLKSGREWGGDPVLDREAPKGVAVIVRQKGTGVALSLQPIRTEPVDDPDPIGVLRGLEALKNPRRVSR